MARRRTIQRTVRELIGQANALRRIQMRRVQTSQSTLDWTRQDYAFWDKARWGRVRGLELGGLFLKPLSSKVAAWVFGQPPRWMTSDEATQAFIEDWWTEHHALILRAYEEAVALGDCFVVVNADLSVTILPPNVVEPLIDDDDFSLVVGWRVTQTHADPNAHGRVMTVIDEFRAETRTQRVIRDGVETVTTYRNPIGIVPVVHIANEPRADEMFGRPEGYGLVYALHRYSEMFDAAIEGNIRQGRPTPVAEMDSPEALEQFFATYGTTRTVEHDDGTSETFTEVAFDSDNFLALLGKFRWESPGSFSGDTSNLLGLIFYLVLQHTEIPEFVWGNAIASSKASAESQMPPFLRWVTKRRGQLAATLEAITERVLAYARITTPAVKLERVTPIWDSLTDEDGRLTLETVRWAYAEGLLDRTTALMLAPIEVRDAERVLDQAAAEREAEQLAALGMDANDQLDLALALAQAQAAGMERS